MPLASRKLGSSGIEVCPVALGAWAIGGGPWWGESDDAESIRAIQAGLDAGINFIDTAPGYGFGRSEEVVGKAIRGRRDNVVVATKCGLWWQDDRGTRFFELDGHVIHRCLRPETIRIECEQSLRRLGVETIDLYQTHWPVLEADPTPIADTMECLLKLRDEGKIRAIGVSNVSVDQMEEYRAVGCLDTNQPHYSMLERTVEAEVVPYTVANGISNLAYMPLEQGLLTGKVMADQTFSEGQYRNLIPWFQPGPRGRVLKMLAGWSDLTSGYGCSLSQLVIAWTVAQPGITVALCGARKAAHAVENAEAAGLTISAGHLARMRADIEALGAP